MKEIGNVNKLKDRASNQMGDVLFRSADPEADKGANSSALHPKSKYKQLHERWLQSKENKELSPMKSGLVM